MIKRFLYAFVSFILTMSLLAGMVLFLIFLAKPSNDPREDFRQAAEEARWPSPKFVSHSLFRFKFDHPITVVTWTHRGLIQKFKDGKGTEGGDVWVTLSPSLKQFCQEYVRLHDADEDQLELRLEQLLGLPPEHKYDTFVELEVDPKDAEAKLIRPCSDSSGDSSLDTTSCNPPILPAAADVWPSSSNPSTSAQFQEWMLRNYYSTYATQRPYPWTALGYTFDWARKDNSDEFMRFGESEFVIPKGTPVHFVSDDSTIEYCTRR